MYTSGTSTTNIVIQTTGVYGISFIGTVGATGTVSRVLPRLYKNATVFVQTESIVTDSGTSSGIYLHAKELLTAGDVLTARVLFVGGSAYIINGAAAPSQANTRLTLTWIGRTS
jgi:hypothetical protein